MVMVGCCVWRLHLLISVIAALICSPICRATAVSIEDPSQEKPAGPIHADFVLKSGTVVDGTGAPARQADVAVRAGRIVAVGAVEVDPGTRVIDVKSRVVAPDSSICTPTPTRESACRARG